MLQPPDSAYGRIQLIAALLDRAASISLSLWLDSEETLFFKHMASRGVVLPANLTETVKWSFLAHYLQTVVQKRNRLLQGWLSLFRRHEVIDDSMVAAAQSYMPGLAPLLAHLLHTRYADFVARARGTPFEVPSGISCSVISAAEHPEWGAHIDRMDSAAAEATLELVRFPSSDEWSPSDPSSSDGQQVQEDARSQAALIKAVQEVGDGHSPHRRLWQPDVLAVVELQTLDYIEEFALAAVGTPRVFELLRTLHTVCSASPESSSPATASASTAPASTRGTAKPIAATAGASPSPVPSAPVM